MRFGKANFKRAVSAILAASLIFSVTPVTAMDAAGEAEITVTDVPVVGEEIISAESETEVVTETTVPEISEIPETSETVTELLDFIENENDFSMFSPISADIQLNKVSETDSSISISWSDVYGETFSHYEVYCNGAVVQTGLTDTAYTVTGLAGGNEYGISVYAYDIEGNVIGMSDTEYYYTNWTVSGDTVLTSDKIVSNLYINSGTLNLNGHTLTVKGNVYLGSNGSRTYLNINNGKLYVDGNFNMCRTNGGYGEGYLTMTNSDDYICVNGDFYVYTYYNYSSLTNGTLEVKGNFTQRQYSYADNFNPGGNHRVLLSGEGLQTVSFARTESRFNILEVRNYSAEGVVFSTPVTMNKYIDNGCNVTFSNGERTGWTLEADETIEGDLNLSTGVLDLNGHKLTIIGNLIHSGGTVLVNGGELEVQGDYRVQALNGTSYTNSTGVLNMTNEADTVRVMGQFVMQSTASHSGKLTAGTLEIGGNLTQAGANSYNFCTSGSHTVILNGTEKQSISINDNYRDYSRFNNLKITNTSAEGVNFARTAYVVGNLYNTESKVENGLNIYVAGTTKFPDNAWNHNIRFVENWTLQEDLRIGGGVSHEGGTLNLNGHTLVVNDEYYLWNATLYINGGRLEVGKNFYYGTESSDSSGTLNMTNTKDYVLVNGNFTAHAWYNQSGKLTAGILEVKGNFTQRKRGNDCNFYPTGTHKVILSGESLQKVDFTSTGSRFNVLEIQNYSEEGVSFVTTVTIIELIDNGCNVSFANGERSGWTLEEDETIEGDLNLSRGTLDLNGHKLTITGNLIHSGGTVLVNGGELEVQGDYRVQALNGTSYTNSTGVLNMTNEADTVKVMGQFVMQSTASHSGKLTAGTLEIGGNLTQAGASSYNFCTSGSHTVVLNGTEKQSISINNNYRDYSRFNNLKITNTSAEGVNFARTVYVVGELYNTESNLINSSYIYILDSTQLRDNQWNHNITFAENRTITEDTTIKGDLYIIGGTTTFESNLNVDGMLYLNGGTVNLNGHTLEVKGNVYLSASGNNCYLNINKGKFYVDGNFNMQRSNGDYGSGYLTMTNAEDYICVNGDFTVNVWYSYNKLTDGIIEVKGDFTQKRRGNAYTFNSSGNHKVILSGEALQTVNFAETESGFNILEIQNYSDEGVVFKTTVTIGELIDNGCNVSFANGERSGWTLEADETIEGDVNLARGTLDLNGHKLTITGNLIHSGGTVLVNGGELEVQGDYRVQALNGTSYTNSTGVLNMTNEADTVKVMGQFVMQSTASHSGKFTAGTLEIGGNLTQAGANSYNFCTSGSHTVILNGTEKQSISIANYGKDNSRFNNLKITNTSVEGVTFARVAYVVGSLYNTETKITNGSNIYVPATMKFADNAWNHDIWICENRTLSEDLEIGGTLYLNGGTLNLNGHTLTVKGNVYLNTNLNVNKGKLYADGNFNMSQTNGNGGSGYLTMTNAEDYICVNGDLYVASYYNYSNLTNGTIEVKGNFTQKHTSYPNNFVPSGSHKVILSGESLQTVSFDRTESRFNILEIQNYSDEGVVFKTTVTIGELIDNGCNVSFANGERSGWTLEADETIEGDVNLARGTLDLNGHKLTIIGNLIHSGGTVLINGGELEVQGDYRVQALNGTSYTNSTGVLNMTNEADTVRVMGQFVMQSTASHSGKLTAGTLEIGGNLTQAGANSYNFCTSGSHTVVLNGTEKQTVSINNTRKDYSRFNNLKITNTSADGVDFLRTSYVVGNLYNTETKITNGANLVLTGTFADNVWSHDIWLNENRILSEDLEIGGNLYLDGGSLNLNGHTLTVKGNVYLSNAYLNVNKGKMYVDGNFNMSYTNGSGCSGYLTMTNAEDYICVNGNLYVASYYNYSSLTNGTIEVKGNFTQKHTSYPNNFVPSGNHKVILSGGKLQKVEFATTQSYFNILEITKPLDTGYVFSRTPLWNELIEGKADTEAPTAPKNLKFVRSNSSSIAMTWGASSDNAAIYCYYIYRNGERVGNTTKTEYIDNGLKSHTSYEYYIVACDTSGNLSEWSNILEASTDVDAFAPTQPANLAAKIQSEGVVRLSWTASSDNGTVVKYNVYRNGTLIGSSNGTAFTDSTAFGGYYEYYVEAVDNEDNVSRASASVFVDNLAPGAPVLTLNSVKDDYVSLSWECSDNVGVVKYDLYRNDVKIKSFNANAYLDTAVSLDTNYTYYVTAYDAAGNVSEISNEVTVYTGEDDVVPVIFSIEYTGKPSFKNTVITVSATDNCGVSKIFLKYSSDKINWTDCGSETASGKAAVTVKFGVDTSEMTDGTVYLCAYAEDINGNVSAIENSPVYSFSVDNTAPNAPTDVTLNIKNAQIEIRWTAPKDKDTSYFKVYRKTDNSDFVLIKDNCKYINYFDKDIELGVEYSYYVTAVDQNGNESDYSEIVTGGISDDNVKPEILSISPANNSKIGEDVFVSISCRDNYKLGSITVTCKKANDTEETEVFKSELSKYAEVVGFDLDTSNFENGLYEISAIAVDSVGNISDKYTVTYDYKGCGLSAPVLSAEGAGWSVNLSWDMTNTDGLVDYYVYRKSSAVSDYVAIASVTESKYTDYDVTAGKKYYYKVRAWDDRDNYIESSEVTVSPTYEDSFAPVANAGFDLFAIVGESLTFDGSQSYDNHYVASYEWNFGDGTTAEGVMPKHSYSEAGEYTVKLTVKDSGGNSNSSSIKVTVYDDEYSKVEITTLSGNSRLGNVMIYCELPNSESTDFSTNSNGTFEFIAPKGTYTVYFYKSGYTPVSAQINTENQKKVSVSLKNDQFITGEWKVETLDLDEIVSLGIDVNDPANQVVYRYTANVKGNGQVSFTANGDGEFFGDDFAEYEYEDKRTRVTAKSFGGGSRSGSSHRGPSGSGGSGGGSGEKTPQMIAIFSVTTNISWLKEFFEVELTITNEAGNEFYLDNSKAEITLPAGLSLADTLIGEWESKNMGIIKGGQSESASWILRGDKPGEYTDVKAKFSASLMPFGEPVTVDFVNDGAPIVVHGSKGISLKVTASEYDDYWSMKFVLTNNSGRPLYNVLASFEGEVEVGEITDMILYYSNGTTITVPWNGGKPQYELAEKYYSAFDPINVTDWVDGNGNDISSYTLENEDTLTGMYSVSKEWVYK